MSAGYWDAPSPGPYQRRPMEQLLIELAERTGRPVWPVTHANPSTGGSWRPPSLNEALRQARAGAR